MSVLFFKKLFKIKLHIVLTRDTGLQDTGQAQKQPRYLISPQNSMKETPHITVCIVRVKDDKGAS